MFVNEFVCLCMEDEGMGQNLFIYLSFLKDPFMRPKSNFFGSRDLGVFFGA